MGAVRMSRLECAHSTAVTAGPNALLLAWVGDTMRVRWTHCALDGGGLCMPFEQDDVESAVSPRFVSRLLLFSIVLLRLPTPAIAQSVVGSSRIAVPRTLDV